jgi:oligopeptide transport system ATP-binding protein
VRGAQISMIFQDPMTSLNPVLTIGRQLEEPLMLHVGMTKKQANERAAELLTMVGIPKAKDRLGDYPHQYSGGMRQRVMIAMALSCSPQILIADEPTTALDVTIQAQIMELVKRLRDELGMAVVWITHDLGVVAGLAQRVLVMYGGFIIEEASVNDLYANPTHPYTIGLLGSLPRVDETVRTKLYSIEGLPPVLYQKPNACPFAPRCKWAMERCWKENPALEPVSPEHRVACCTSRSTAACSSVRWVLCARWMGSVLMSSAVRRWVWWVSRDVANPLQAVPSFSCINPPQGMSILRGRIWSS